MSLVRLRPEAPLAGIAHLVERHLAKVEVASSSLVARSKKERSASRQTSLFWNPVSFHDGNQDIILFPPRGDNCETKSKAVLPFLQRGDVAKW